MCDMAACTRETSPSIVWSMVSTNYYLATTTNKTKGGRKVLGLSSGLSVVYRGRGGVEVALSGRRRVSVSIS